MNLTVWKERIQLQHKSGLSIDAWCKEQGVAVSSFYKWKRRCSPSLFEKVDVQEAPLPAIPHSLPIVLYVGDVRIVLEEGFSKSCLKQLLEVVSS